VGGGWVQKCSLLSLSGHSVVVGSRFVLGVFHLHSKLFPHPNLFKVSQAQRTPAISNVSRTLTGIEQKQSLTGDGHIFAFKVYVSVMKKISIFSWDD
jgi:hypothetical protein